MHFPVLFGFVCQYISWMIGWEDYTLVISFVSKGFPHKAPIEEFIYCNGFILRITNT